MSPAVELDRLWSASADAPDLQLLRTAFSGAVAGEELLFLLRADQQRRWQAGQPLLVEDYLQSWPDLPAGVDWKLELLAGELLNRPAAEQLTAEDVSRRFPEHGELPVHLAGCVTAGDAGVRLELIVDHLDRLFREDKCTPCMEYLLAVLNREQRERAFPELLAIELRWQQRRGATIIPQVWQQRFPGYAAAITQAFGAEVLGAGSDAGDLLQATVQISEGATNTGGRAAAGLHPAIGRLGDYDLLSELGRGGMGVVYRARQRSLNRLVALKTVLAGAGAGGLDILRFRNEAEAAANLRHPGIVGVYEVGESEGRHYYSMEFIEGHDLSRLIRQNSLPGERAAAYVRQLADAVQYAHEQGVLHRDLKPQNVLVDAQGVLRITDFGLAKRVHADSQLTGDFSIMGTPSYMPPEQAQPGRGAAGPWSDIYSLGAVLYELLTTRPPFRADNPLETMRQVLDDEPIAPRLLNPRIALDLQTICLKCLEKDPSRRYGSARMLSEELGRYLEGRPILARPLGRVQRLWRLCRRHPRESLLTGLVLSVVLLGSMAVGWQWLRAESNLWRADRNFQLLGQAADEMLVVVEEWVTRAPPRSEAQKTRLSSSLRLFEAFLREEPASQVAQQRLAETHVRVGEIRRLLRELDKAAHHFREAVRIYHRLHESAADIAFEAALARTLDKLGNTERESERYGDAGAAFEEALKIQRRLAGVDEQPLVHADLARTLYNRGVLRFQQNEAQGAQSDFEESIAESVWALQRDPANSLFLQGLARCRINLGVLLRNLGRPGEGLRQYDEAIGVLRQLVEQAPEKNEFALELAQVQLNRGNLLLSAVQVTPPVMTDPLQGAAEAYADAVRLLELLHTEYPNVPQYHIELASALNGLGGVQEEQQQSEQARESWQRARQEFERVLRLSGESAEVCSKLALTLANLARLVPKDQPLERIPLLQEACGHQRLALSKTPMAKPIQSYLRSHLLSLARACLLAGQHVQSAASAEEMAGLELQPWDWQLAAELLVRAAVVARADSGLTQEQGRSMAGDYERRAVAALKRALAGGKVSAEGLRVDERFAALHENPLFEELFRGDAGK